MTKKIEKKTKKPSIVAEIKEANIKAAADPIYHGRSRIKVKLGEVAMALIAAVIGSFASTLR